MITFNIFTGNFDFVGSSSVSVEDGSQSNSFTSLNIKNAKNSFFYKIKDDLENVVTRFQKVDGVLIIDGVNTVL